MFSHKKDYILKSKKKEYDDTSLDEVCILKIQELKEALDFTLKIENYDES